MQDSCRSVRSPCGGRSAESRINWFPRAGRVTFAASMRHIYVLAFRTVSGFRELGRFTQASPRHM